MLGIIISFVTVVVCALASPTDVANELTHGRVASRYLSTEEKIAQDGYYSESHAVTTSDGYILEVSRIPYRRFETKQNAAKTSKPAVYLMHGLQSSSLCYVNMGPERSLAYLLADDGYDVWLGNARGVLTSRRHVNYNPDVDSEEFFDYSFEDIGMKDLPAIIDYILKVTGKSQLHYVGHSQGGTAFLVLNSMLPEYNNKIASAHLLAGVGYMDNFPNRVLSLVALTTNLIYAYAISRGIVEILGPDTTNSLVNDCNNNSAEACSILTIQDILGEIFENTEILGGASVKQYAHFGQNIRSKSFSRWNYGPVTNLARYGSINPPKYDIRRISADVTMHYTVSDDLLDEKDVIRMANAMPNTKVRKIARESYTHNDFVVAPDSKELVYDYILGELNKHKR